MRSVMHPIACVIDVHKKKLACTIIIAESMQVEQPSPQILYSQL